MGVITRDLRGIWHAMLPFARLETVELGTQYLGLRGGFHAARIVLRGAGSVIVGFENDAARTRALALLAAKAMRPTTQSRGVIFC